jgi:hypothetical protein
MQSSIKRTIAVGSTTFGSAVLGMLAQLVIPAHTLSDAKGTIGAMIGLVTLLLALVLGLVIWTAFSVYTTQQSEAQSLGPVIVELDLTLEKYGPEAALGRSELRAALQRSRARFFGGGGRTPQPFTLEESRATMRGMGNYFDSLRPATDLQKQHLATARSLAVSFAQTQMLMARQLANPVPHFLLVVVVCWSAALFFGNGLASAINSVTVLTLLAGSIAISSAIFLIVELSEPYTGVFRLSSSGIDELQLALERADAKTLP